MSRALILDCDGVLADTEREGHLVAFNETFAELGLPFRWSDEEYAQLVRIGGGKERLRSVLTPAVATGLGLHDEDAIAAAVLEWHQVKTQKYKEIVFSGRLPGRPGVARLIASALDADWKLAIASTSAHESVVAVLRHVVGDQIADRVGVFAGDIVARKKPAPDIYLHAAESLGVPAKNAVVVEDSGVGCSAAIAAGMATIVTVSSYTGGDDFEGAAIVLSDLGEPDRPARTLSNPLAVDLRGHVDPDVLERVLLATSTNRLAF